MKKFIIFLLAAFLVTLPGMALAAGSAPQTRDGSGASQPGTFGGVTPVDPLPYPGEVAPVYPVVPAYPGDGGSIDVDPPSPPTGGEVVPPYPGTEGSGGTDPSGGYDDRDIAVPPLPPAPPSEPGQIDSGAPIPERTLPPDIEYIDPEKPASGDMPIGNSDNSQDASRGDVVTTQDKRAEGQEYAGPASLVSIKDQGMPALFYIAGVAVIVLTAIAVAAVILKKRKA
ncbi:MAG TPA: hypothetical protein PK830_07545 [Candidatus Atribacteria bacterium]|nr:hypothetical protein [Candidatus Atribacteria bacterium]HPT78939.1 hypothetical protein [Candidatus Atribacteria bacterium]